MANLQTPKKWTREELDAARNEMFRAVADQDALMQKQYRSAMERQGKKDAPKLETPLEAYRKNRDKANIASALKRDQSAGNVLSSLARLRQYEPEQADNMLSQFVALRQDKKSRYYAPYLTGKSTLKSGQTSLPDYFGVDTFNDDWLRENSGLMDHLEYTAAGNVKAPTGKSTELQKAAYYYYQVQKAESGTKALESEWSALQKDVTEKAKSGLYASDDDIIQSVDWAQYKSLQKYAENNKALLGTDLTRPVMYGGAEDLYGVLWASRNGQQVGGTATDYLPYTANYRTEREYNSDPYSKSLDAALNGATAKQYDWAAYRESLRTQTHDGGETPAQTEEQKKADQLDIYNRDKAGIGITDDERAELDALKKQYGDGLEAHLSGSTAGQKSMGKMRSDLLSALEAQQRGEPIPEEMGRKIAYFTKKYGADGLEAYLRDGTIPGDKGAAVELPAWGRVASATASDVMPLQGNGKDMFGRNAKDRSQLENAYARMQKGQQVPEELEQELSALEKQYGKEAMQTYFKTGTLPEATPASLPSAESADLIERHRANLLLAWQQQEAGQDVDPLYGKRLASMREKYGDEAVRHYLETGEPLPQRATAPEADAARAQEEKKNLDAATPIVEAAGTNAEKVILNTSAGSGWEPYMDALKTQVENGQYTWADAAKSYAAVADEYAAKNFEQAKAKQSEMQEERALMDEKIAYLRKAYAYYMESIDPKTGSGLNGANQEQLGMLQDGHNVALAGGIDAFVKDWEADWEENYAPVLAESEKTLAEIDARYERLDALQELSGEEASMTALRAFEIADGEPGAATLQDVTRAAETLRKNGVTGARLKGLEAEQKRLEQVERNKEYAALSAKKDFVAQSSVVPNSSIGRYINQDWGFATKTGLSGVDIIDSAKANFAGIEIGISQYMTLEEKKIFNYLHNTQGEEAAKAYYEDLNRPVEQATEAEKQEMANAYAQGGEEALLRYVGTHFGTLRERASAISAERMEDFSKESPIVASALSIITNMMNSVAAPMQIVAALVGDEETRENLTGFSDMTGTIRQTVSNGMDNTGKFFYNTTMSLADNVTALVTGAGLFGKGTKAAQVATQMIMSSGAASGTLQEATARGLDPATAVLQAVGSGAIEWLTEKYSIEALFSDPKNAALYVLKNMAIEPTEEVASNIMNTVLDVITAGDQNKLIARKNELVKGGMTEQEATNRVLEEQLYSIGEDALSAAITGGVMAGGMLGIGKAGSALKGHQINKTLSSAFAILQQAEQGNAETQSAAIAATLTGLDGTLSPELARATAAQLISQKGADAVAFLEDLFIKNKKAIQADLAGGQFAKLLPQALAIGLNVPESQTGAILGGMMDGSIPADQTITAVPEGQETGDAENLLTHQAAQDAETTAETLTAIERDTKIAAEVTAQYRAGAGKTLDTALEQVEKAESTYADAAAALERANAAFQQWGDRYKQMAAQGTITPENNAQMLAARAQIVTQQAQAAKQEKTARLSLEEKKTAFSSQATELHSQLQRQAIAKIDGEEQARQAETSREQATMAQEASTQTENTQTLEKTGPPQGVATETTQQKPSKQRQFGHETAQASSAIDQPVKDYLYKNSDYTPDKNAEQIDRGIAWVREKATESDPYGYSAAKKEVLSTDFDYRSADGQARMLTVLSMAAQYGDVDGQTEIAQAYNKQGTTIGQMLQARKIFGMMTPLGRIALLQKEVDAINQRYISKGKSTRVGLTAETLDAAGKAKTSEEFDAVQKSAWRELAQQMPPTFGDKIQAWRMLSMLGNLRTHGRNMLGNALMLPVVSLKNLIGAGLESTMLKAGQERTKALGVSEDIRAFAQADAEKMQTLLTGEGKYNPDTQIDRARAVFGTKDGEISKTVGKLLQKAVDVNGNALEAEDWIFLKRHYANALGSYLKANHVTVEQAGQEGQLMQRAREYAILEAQKATYRDANEIASKLAKIERGGGVLGFIVKAAMPFKKTPLNILKRGMEYSPVGLIKALSTGKSKVAQYQAWESGELKALPKGALSPTQYIDSLASGLTGTAISALGAALAALGVVTVGIDDDDKFGEMNGKQEYAVNLKLFGYEVSYTIDWAAPACMPFFVGAGIYNAITKEREDSGNFSLLKTAGHIWDAIMEITEPVFNLSMLDGLNSLLTVNSFKGGNSITSIIEKLLTNYASSMVPTLAGQISRTIDPTRRKNYVESGAPLAEAQYAFESIQNKTPFSVSNIPYRDPFGEEDRSPAWLAAFENLISPGYITVTKPDAVVKELETLYGQTGESGLVPKLPEKYFTVNGEKVILTDKQYDQLTKERGETAKSTLEALISLPQWSMMDDGAKADMVSDAWVYATQKAKANINPGAKMDAWVRNAIKAGNATEAIQARAEAKAKKAYADGYETALYEALTDADMDTAQTSLAALKKAGKTDAAIKEMLTKHYKPIYQDAGKNKDAAMATQIRNTLIALGIGYKTTDFNKWIK